MQQAGEVGAWRHADAGKGLLDGAGAADTLADFDDEHALAGAGQRCRADQAIVAGADDDRVPGLGGEFADVNGETDFAEDGRCGGVHDRSNLAVWLGELEVSQV